jgi:WD40 repeat protein
MFLMKVRQVERIQKQAGVIYDAAYAPAGDRLAASTQNGNVYLYNTTAWTKMHTFKHNGWISSIAWHPSLDILLCGGKDGLFLWDVQSLQLMKQFGLKGVWCVAWFPDGERLVFGEPRGTVYVYVLWRVR